MDGDRRIYGAENGLSRRAAVKAAGTPAATRSKIVTCPDTPHAFNADYRVSDRKGPAEGGRKRALAWFKANGVG